MLVILSLSLKILILLLATSSSTLLAEQRIALVIGNAAYQQGALDNPVNDATAISAKLSALGFEVVSVYDADLRSMQRGLLQFVDRIERGATSLVFYAGHAVQVNGRNYLMPVDGQLTTEQAIKFDSMELGDILEALEQSAATTNLIILDACRNNPFEKKFRGGSRGLAIVDASAGSLIAYATAPGSVAADGDGTNGLYTSELLKVLDVPGLTVEDVFKRVRRSVMRASSGEQVPWESSSLISDFVFNGDPIDSVQESIATNLTNVKRVETPALEDRCDNLGGIWQVETEKKTCNDSMILTRTDTNQYDMIYNVCGAAGMVTNTRGSGMFDDYRYTVKWSSMPCGGTTIYEFDEGCHTGRGQVVKTTGLPFLCKAMIPKDVVMELSR